MNQKLLEHEHKGMVQDLHEIDQILGKAMGHPYYDEVNFPGASHMVCTGEHTPVTLADAIASRFTKAKDLIEKWEDEAVAETRAEHMLTVRVQVLVKCARELRSTLKEHDASQINR